MEIDLSIKKLSNESLLAKLNSLRSNESHILAEIILYLSELDSRQYYRDLGYSSLFSFCTGFLGYSESAAYRRIQAARLLNTNPEVYQKVQDNRLSPSAIAEVAKVKEAAPVKELLVQAEGKSKREVERLSLQYQPAAKPKKEKVKPVRLIAPEPDLFSVTSTEPVVKEAYSITIEVDKDFMELLNEVKELIGHQPVREVFRKTLKEYADKRKTVARKFRSNPAATIPGSRFISKSVKVEVRNRDNYQCTFVSEDGRRCTEKHALEFDHILPASAGGSTEISNLRLLCKSHNLLMAERFFGREKIQCEIKRHTGK